MVIFSGTKGNDDTTKFYLQSELISDDILTGDLGQDLLKGFDGNDEIRGGAGNDLIDGGTGDDSLYGGNDDDQIRGHDGNDLINGGFGHDSLYGGAGDDEIRDGDGNNLIYGGAGNDSIYSGAGDDEIRGQNGNDLIIGGAGNDSLYGGNGEDEIRGHDGNDLINGGFGNDSLYGGNGDDEIRDGDGNNLIYGGAGNDSLYSGAGDDEIKGQAGNDLINGGSGNDSLDGGAGEDEIRGGAGNDSLDGGAGNDALYGGNGDDQIKGGLGNDVITLGNGKDTLVLETNNGYDRVIDFTNGEDKIQLEGGISYGDLEILSQDNHTVIKNQSTGENLVKLENVNVADIDAGDFVLDLDVRSLDGSGNNLLNESLGQAGDIYLRVGETNYAEGGEIDDTLPNARFVSNRVFNDLHVNLFSENDASHLVFVWGQFLDHTFGLAQGGTESANIGFDNSDPLEDFQNDFGAIRFNRSASTIVDGQKEQINTVSSFIDGWAIYGGTEERLEWLREGSVDGDLSNNSAKLLLPDGYLPTADARGDHTTAPGMDLMSRLRQDPASAVIAGDVRANENTGLTATHTLFAREHNRIVDLLPNDLDEETKFQITRKVVTATQQYITYNEYLPSIGIELDPYQGYDPNVNPSITNEFATVGYRAHSMVHGDFDFDIRNLSDADLASLEAQGALRDGDQIEVPVNTQSGNPSVVSKVGLGSVFEGLFETNYNNDVQIDNQLRSILFQIPVTGGEFTDGPPIEQLFNGVVDIGAIDIQRGRDHGIASYNDLRETFGLERVNSFYDITGEDPEAIAAFVDSEDLKNVDGTRITSADLIFDAADVNLNDPSIIDFIAVLDNDGNVEADPQEIAELLADNEEVEGISAIQRSTVAARLEAIYQDVDNVDAFSGMIAEEHLPGTEFGELQYAIWKEQFEDLRDGDRFFHLNDADLVEIEDRFGISYQQSFADIIANNTDLDRGDIFDDVFVSEPHLAVDQEVVV